MCKRFRSSLLLALGLTVAAVPLMGATDKINGDAYGAYLAGQWAAAWSDPARASYYYDKAYKLAPETPALAERLLAESLSVGDMPQAIRVAKALSTSPSVGRLAQFVLAVDTLSKGNYKAAQKAFHAVGAMGGAGASSPLLEAWAIAGMGQYDWALTTLDTVAIEGKALSEVARAMIAERAGNAPMAEVAYYNVVRSGQMSSPLIVAFGQFLARQNKAGDAEKLFKAVLTNTPDDPLIRAAHEGLIKGQKAAQVDIRQGAAMTIAMAAMAGGTQQDPLVAVILLRLALHLDPQAEESKVLLARALMRSGATKAARGVYADIPVSSVYAASATEGLAHAMHNMGQTAEAIRILEARFSKAKTTQDQQTLREALSEFYQLDRRYADAARLLDQLVTDNPDDQMLILRRGMMRERLGQWDAAHTDLEAVVNAQPDNALALNYLGYSLLDRGIDKDRAFSLIEKAAALKPDDGAIKDSLGWAYFLRGDVKAALVELERAAEIEPADPTVNHHLGDVYAKLGRNDEARWQWQRALTLNPDDKERGALEAKLAAK